VRINLEGLEHQLHNAQLRPGYILTSDVPILLQEARQRVKASFQKQGFISYQTWEVDAHLDWEQLEYASQHVDLFQPYTLIELRFRQALSESLSKKLQTYLSKWLTLASQARIMLMSCEQSLSVVQKTTWFQTISHVYGVINIDSPNAIQFPAWLKKRLQDEALEVTAEGIAYLARLTENNLMAAIQAIQKLKLVYGLSQQTLDRKEIQTVVDNQSQFELFELADSALKGQLDRGLHILNYLEVQNTPPVLVLGYILKVLRLLTTLRYGLEQAKPLPLLFKEHRIWPKQQSAFKQALDRVSPPDLKAIFTVAHEADRVIKGLEKGSNWVMLQKLLLNITAPAHAHEGLR
jgi:DNA polymerase-3 subunit delta